MLDWGRRRRLREALARAVAKKRPHATRKNKLLAVALENGILLPEPVYVLGSPPSTPYAHCATHGPC